MTARVCFLCLLLALGVEARERLTAEQVLRLALTRHPSLQRAHHQVLASQAQAEIVESGLYPQLSLELVAKDGPQGVPNFRLLGLANAGYPQSAGGGVVLTQSFDFGRTSQKLLSQQLLTQAEEQDGQSQRQRLMLQVLRAYGQAVLAQQLSTVAQEMQQARAQIERQAESRFQAGLVSRVDSRLAGAEKAQAEVELREVEVLALLAQAQLRSELGQPADWSCEVEAWPEALESWTTSAEEDLARAWELRPEARWVELKLKSAEADLEVARRGYNPTLSLYAAGGHIANLTGPNATPTSYSTGVALSIPLHTSGGLEADESRCGHLVEAARARVEEVRRQLELQVTQARLRWEREQLRRVGLLTQWEAAREASQLARTRYALGLSDMSELQLAEVARLRAQTQLLHNRAEIWTAWTELLYATGRIGELEGSKP